MASIRQLKNTWMALTVETKNSQQPREFKSYLNQHNNVAKMISNKLNGKSKYHIH